MVGIAWTRDVQRSAWGYGTRDGAGPIHRRMHPVLFRIVFGAFLWVVLAAFAGFSGGTGSVFLIGVATFLLAAYIAVPFVLDRIRTYRDGKRGHEPVSDWAQEHVETQSGPVTGREAMIQAATGPVSLAVAMTAIAIVAAIAA